MTPADLMFGATVLGMAVAVYLVGIIALRWLIGSPRRRLRRAVAAERRQDVLDAKIIAALRHRSPRGG